MKGVKKIMKDFAEKLHESEDKHKDDFIEELKEKLKQLPEREVELIWAFMEGLLAAQRIEEAKAKNKVKLG